jgi:hypothetical protein
MRRILLSGFREIVLSLDICPFGMRSKKLSHHSNNTDETGNAAGSYKVLLICYPLMSHCATTLGQRDEKLKRENKG